MNVITINVGQGGCNTAPLLIGYAGEDSVDAVDFDFSSWAQDYGEGTVTLELMRASDTAPYPAILAVDGTVARWTVSDVDTARSGPGVAQLVYQPTGATKKSAIYKFFVGKSLTEPGEDEPWGQIIERMEEILTEMQQQAAAADQSAQNAEAWAVGERGGEPVPVTDETHENNAKYYADEAGEIVSTFTETTAPAAVQAVNTAAQTALTAVSDAQTAAVSAVQQKGDDVLDELQDYADLPEDVANLNSAMQSNVDFLFVTSNIVAQYGLTIEKINDTTFQIYGIATATGYFTLFNGVEQIQATTSTPTKIVPAGEYTVEIDNPDVKIRYTLNNVWSGALPLESGIVDFSSNAAVAFLANKNTDFGTSENPTTIEVRIRKTVTSAAPWILEPSNGDDTQAAWLNLYRYGKCELREGIYHIAKLRMPDNSTLSGCGTKSSIIVNDIVGILPANSCVVRDVALDGGGADDVIPTEEGSVAGIVIAVENVQRVRIENCYIHGFASSAIVARDIGGGIRTDIVISRCNLWYNYRGIYLRRQAEYLMISDCSICCNYFGVLNRGGNNKFSNCDIDSNIINVQIDMDEGTNGGHGSMVGCSFNHSNNRENDGYSLIIKDTGRELISGCNFHYGKTRLENTSGNVFSGCGFGNTTGIEVDGGGCSIFSGCCFKSTQESPISLVNNDTVEFVDCYTRAGDAVEITAYPKASAAELNDLESEVAELADQIEDLNYKPVSITAFSVSPNQVEIGSTVSSATLSWTINKKPTTLTLDGDALTPVASGTETKTGLSLTANKTFTLAATDSGSPSHDPASASKTATLSFLSKVHYGLGSGSQEITDAFINGLTGVLAATRQRTVSFTPSGSQYIYFALPQIMCSGINFVVASGAGQGFALAVDQIETGMSHTNASGGVVAYNVYKSVNPISSALSVKIE